MMLKKNNLKKIYALLFFGAIFLSSIYGVNGLNTSEEPNLDTPGVVYDIETEIPPIVNVVNDVEQVEDINFYGEDVEMATYDRSAIDWRPIEETLAYLNLGANNEADSGSIETASYDTITGIETITTPQFLPKPETGSEISFVEPYVGLLPNPPTREDVYGTDGRTLVSSQNVFPYRSIVKLYITASDGTNWVGSGAIIDNFHVLTAGHCVFLPDNGGWASDIEVVPAMDTSDTPSDPNGHAWVTGMRSYTGWTISESSQHDWAVITLDRNIGFYTGWMGRTTAGSGSSIYDNTMYVAGYPADLSSGNRMYLSSETGRGATSNNHYYEADTAGGMSGGPVWRYVSGNRYIMTVHAYGQGGSPNPNFGTRLNTNKYDQIFTWLGEDTAPTDKPDMKDRGSAYWSATSGTITAGVTAFTVSNGLRNVGTAATGGFWVHYYASTNNIISAGDYLIGSDYVSSIAPLSTGSASSTATFPASIPAGSYYIGWIIDKDNIVSEFDETNNKEYISGSRTVLGVPPPTGYIEVRVKDSVTSADLGSANVKVYEDASGILIDSGYTDSSGFYNVTALDIGWFTLDVSRIGYYPQSKQNYINWEGDDDYLTYYLIEMPVDSGYIEVNVKDSDTNLPLSSVLVQTYNMTSGVIINSGWTDSNGFYNVTGLRIGWYEVKVDRTSYKPQMKQNYINWRGDDDYLYFYMDLMPPDSGYIEVRVYNETGSPQQNVYVKCINDSSGSIIRTGWTDVDGFFNVTGLTIGWYTINTSYTSYYEQSKSNYINWFGDDDYLSFFLQMLPPDSGFIEIYVYDSVTGAVISGAYVTVKNDSSGSIIQTGYTDSAGFFKAVNLTVGWFTVSMTRVGYHAQSKIDFINWIGDDDYLFYYMVELPPDSGYIEVIVKDTNTLLPIEGSFVSCAYTNGTIIDSGYTDSSGFFNITGLYVGWYTVTVSDNNYGGESRDDYINWNGDDDYLFYYLDLKPPGWIELTVEDSLSHLPIENAYVRCYNYTNGELFDEGYTDSAGFYNITDLLVGWWEVNVSYPGYEEASRFDYIDWRGDEDFLTIYLENKIEVFEGSVAIFRDILPWGLNMTEPILETYGISYDLYNSSDFGSVDLSLYEKVIIPSDQTANFYTLLSGNKSWFESYVSAGGVMDLRLTDRGWGGGDWDGLEMPGGLNKTFSYLESVSINMPQHTLVNKPFTVEDVELDGWFYSAHGYFHDYPADAKKILIDTVSGDPVLLEFKLGSGFIIATMQTLEWNENQNLTRLLENMILYDPLQGFDWLEVTSPASSDLLLEPSTYSINWNATGTISNIKIDLYENDIFLMEIIASTPNDGEYSWTVPDGLSDSTTYQIKISDTAYALTNDMGEYFEIETRSITVDSPTGSSFWEVASVNDINWSTTGYIAYVKIDLYLDGTLEMEITGSTTNDGSFSWILPYELSDSTLCTIRVSDASNLTIYDVSDNFEIEDLRSITVTIPDSAITWSTISTETITWSSTGIIANVKIDLYLDGSFTMEITASTTNNGSFSWNIPVELSESTLYTIRISDLADLTFYNESDNFEIEDLRSITVTIPDSATTWSTISTETITWSSTGIIANVKIDLFLNGTFEMEFTASTTNNGSFSWNIPVGFTESTQYTIRISDASDLTIYDESANFEIEDLRSITVTIPDSATIWSTISTETIEWSSTGVIADVKIDLYLNGVFEMEFTASTTNNGSFSWNIPVGFTESTQYTIRISDASDLTIYDESANFEIEDLRSITVTIPDSATIWSTISTETIEWSSTGVIADVKIDLYLNGAFEMEFTASTTNNGSFSWNIPIGFTESTQYTIRISDASDLTIYDESANFEIEDLRSITVTIPADITSWTFGSTEIIEWSSTRIIADVKIDLYFDGSFQMVIAASTPNDGSLSWEIPDDITSGDLYEIRISDASDTSMYGSSAEFSITMPYGAIPGYDQWIFVSVLLGISFILVKKRRKIAT